MHADSIGLRGSTAFLNPPRVADVADTTTSQTQSRRSRRHRTLRRRRWGRRRSRRRSSTAATVTACGLSEHGCSSRTPTASARCAPSTAAPPALRRACCSLVIFTGENTSVLQTFHLVGLSRRRANHCHSERTSPRVSRRIPIGYRGRSSSLCHDVKRSDLGTRGGSFNSPLGGARSG